MEKETLFSSINYSQDQTPKDKGDPKPKPNTSKEKQNGSITWTQATQKALKHIALDAIWSVPITAIGLLVVALRQATPTLAWCSLLGKEAKSDKPIHVANMTLAIELVWNFLFSLVPLFTCILLLEDTEKTGWKAVTAVISKWKRIINQSIWFGIADSVYRVCMFFAYIYRADQPKYPSWFSFPLNMIWFVSIFVVVNTASKIWTAKFSAYLILQQNLPQDQVQQQSVKVQKTLRRKIILSIVVTAVVGMGFRQLMISVFRVGEESGRAALITTCAIMSYPLWLFMDREGQTSLPWSTQLRSNLNTTSVSAQQTALTSTVYTNRRNAWMDPVEKNGFVLSTFIVIGITITIRMLQANMDTLSSKVAAGLLASSLESIFVVVKPYIFRTTRKLLISIRGAVSTRLRTKKVKPEDRAAIPTNMLDEGEKLNRRKKVYRWHRAHMIILVNRIELISIIFGSGLVLMAVTTKNRAEKAGQFSDTSSECGTTPLIGDILIGMVVMCLIELITELCTYIYILKVERLPLDEVASNWRLMMALFIFFPMMLLYTVSQLITVGYVVLSCTGIDASIFEYHCV